MESSMSFEEGILSSIRDVMYGAVELKVRAINCAKIEVNGVPVKITVCAEPTMFSKTVYATDVNQDNPELKYTTSVIEQLKLLEE